jgi:hypothetical protein
MSQICYGLKISSKEEGDQIVKAINSANFKEILKYTKWSTFQTDWRMFKEFRPDFWKWFMDEEQSPSINRIVDVDQKQQQQQVPTVKKTRVTKSKKTVVVS